MRRGEWKTREGKILAVASMGSEHLRNCVAMLDRQIAKERFSVGLYETLGEQAREAAGDAGAESMLNELALRTKRDELQAELDRRGPRAITSAR